jgi:hypothetical protein
MDWLFAACFVSGATDAKAKRGTEARGSAGLDLQQRVGDEVREQGHGAREEEHR